MMNRLFSSASFDFWSWVGWARLVFFFWSFMPTSRASAVDMACIQCIWHVLKLMFSFVGILSYQLFFLLPTFAILLCFFLFFTHLPSCSRSADSFRFSLAVHFFLLLIQAVQVRTYAWCAGTDYLAQYLMGCSKLVSLPLYFCWFFWGLKFTIIIPSSKHCRCCSCITRHDQKFSGRQLGIS